jgi:hypothetical protein
MPINMNLGSGILQALGSRDVVRCSFVAGRPVENAVSNTLAQALGGVLKV